MQRVVISGAFAALAYRAAAGVVARGDDMISFDHEGSWDDQCEESVVPLKWSNGNGKKVTVKVKGDNNYEEVICGMYPSRGSTVPFI